MPESPQREATAIFQFSRIRGILDMTTYKTLQEIEAKNAMGTRKSWAPYVMTDSYGYSTNGLRFATQEECEAYCEDLEGRWVLVRHYAPCVSDDEVNYRWENGQAVRLEEANATP